MAVAFLSGWTRAAPLTLGTIGSTLTDWPLLVRASNMPVGFWTGADAGSFEDLRDLRFTLADGTLLSHELVQGSLSGSTLQAWVRVPSAATGSVIYAQWQNASATMPTAASQQAAWKSTYKAVHHLSQTSGNYLDSTSNAVDGTVTISSPAARGETGIIGGCMSFDGNDKTTLDEDGTLDLTGDLTISLWVNIDSSALGNMDIQSKGGAYIFYLSAIATTPATWQPRWYGYGAELNRGPAYDLSMDYSTWYLVSVARSQSGGYVEFTRNGTVQRFTVGSALANLTVNDTAMTIGARATSQYFKGLIDESRVAAETLSSDWLTADYASQVSSSWLTTGSVERLATGSIVGQRLMIPRMSLGRLVG